MINKVSSLAPGARKYIDVGRFTNNLIVDIDKFRENTIFYSHLFVTLPLKKNSLSLQCFFSS